VALIFVARIVNIVSCNKNVFFHGLPSTLLQLFYFRRPESAKWSANFASTRANLSLGKLTWPIPAPRWYSALNLDSFKNFASTCAYGELHALNLQKGLHTSVAVEPNPTSFFLSLTGEFE
jgi:hypothetical protein